MVQRADVVLAAIPLLVVGGLVAGRLPDYLERTVGIGGVLTGVPFLALGLVGAVTVIGHEIALGPHPADYEQ